MPPETRTPKRPTAPSLLPIRLSLIMLVNCPCSELLEYFDGWIESREGYQAALTELRNLSTSTLRRLLSPVSVSLVADPPRGCGGREHGGGGGAGLGSAALHVGDVGGDLLGAVRSLLHVAGNLLRRSALLFHRGGNGRGDLRQ